MASKIRNIISQVLVDHRLSPGEFFGPGRTAKLREARCDAAQRMTEAGYTRYRIAQELGRDRETVRLYLSSKAHEKRKSQGLARAEKWKAFRLLAPDTARIVLEIAEAEGVSFNVLAAQWISERATYEVQEKRRAAA